VKFAALVFANLKRKKLRTSLTMLSILVAFILFGLLCAIKQALVGGVELAGADRLVVRHKVSIIQLLPESYKARMERIPGVALAVHQTWFGGIYQDPKNFFMQNPVVPEEFLSMHPEIVLPPEQMKAWLQTRTGAIVGRKTAERFHWKIDQHIPIMSPIWGQRTWDFELVGIFDGRDKGTDTTPFFFRYDYFDEFRQTNNWGKGQVGWYTIRVKDPAQAAEVAKRVDEEFENSAAETKTEPEGAFVQAWAKQIGNIALIVAPDLGRSIFHHPPRHRQHNFAIRARAFWRIWRSQSHRLHRCASAPAGVGRVMSANDLRRWHRTRTGLAVYLSRRSHRGAVAAIIF